MKKIRAVLICSLFVILCVTACNTKDTGSQTEGKSETESKSTETEKPKKEDTESSQPKEDSKEDTKTEPKEDTPVAPKPVAANIAVYCSNDDATAFITKDVSIDSLTSEHVMSALIAQNVVSPETKVLNFEQADVDGQKVIHLDLNTAFSDYVHNFGTAGEYYAIGGLCNTFLSAFHAEGIEIKIEGAPLTTGHAEYTGYMHMFE